MRTIRERLFRPSDLPQITGVEQSVYGSGAYSKYFFRQLYDLYPTLLWVAEDDGKLVGHVCAALAQDGVTGWILNTAVLAHYRRQGIGERLMLRSIDALIQAGARCIKVTSETGNIPAIRLYEKLGFRKVTVEENYYGDGVDRVIMERQEQEQA